MSNPTHLIRTVCAATLTAAVLMGTGCATVTKMPALNKPDAAAASAAPIYLLTVTFKNDYRVRYQPELLVAHVEKCNAREKSDRFNFKPDDQAKNLTDSVTEGYTYTLRLQMPPGDHVLMGFSTLSRKFPFNGFGLAPLLAPLPAEKNGIVYIGHINATVRERQGNEFRAGPVIPLLDQSVTGFSGGTFDISIEDRWARDEETFRARFPGLKDVEIKKVILPPFDRAKVQRWWEDRPL